jgi:hypothetical protein
MEPGLHYHLQTVTYLRVHYWNGIGTNNCWYYCRINETFTLPLELLRLLEQSMIMTMSNCSNDHSCWLPKEVLLCLNSAWATLLLWIQRIPYIHQWNCWKCGLHYHRKQ